jgi:FKBP-type peptidyl-prolyl cis-trans isomerase 2
MEKGDIVQLEYESWIAGTNELFDTTSEDLARKEKVFDEEKKYGPIYAVVGAGRLIQGLDEELLKAEPGKELEAEIPPEKAYGVRDPKNIETLNFNKMARLKIEPEVGKSVVIGNRQGWIYAVFAGRVRVDFNHRLAGKTLRYKYKVVSIPKAPEERVKAVIGMNYGRQEEFQLALEGDDSVTLTVPDVCKYDPNWTIAKLRVVSDLREFTGMKTVIMREVYVKKEAGKEGEVAPAAEGHEGHDHEGHDHEGHDHEGHDHEGHDHEGHAHEDAALEHVDESVPKAPDEQSSE